MDERTPVQVGVDLRPIPLQMQDEAGTVWRFNPDPPPEFMAEAVRLAEQMEDPDAHAWDSVPELRKLLASQIADAEERKAFVKAGYNQAVLNALAVTYASAVVGRPT